MPFFTRGHSQEYFFDFYSYLTQHIQSQLIAFYHHNLAKISRASMWQTVLA